MQIRGNKSLKCTENIFQEVMRIKRPKKFLLIFMIPLIYLMCVILNITVFKGDKYAHMAANQRTNQTQTTRGAITDRNMIPLTGADKRYTNDSLARHVIGYTDSFGMGVSGIEKELDAEISSKSQSAHSSLKDAKGNDIPSFKTADTRTEQLKHIKLTLDYHIQNIAENVLDESGITGAAVVLDTENFDILAMASRPNFDQNNVAEYISSDGTALLNRATTPYNASAISDSLLGVVTDSEITPLQAAEAACTIAAGGMHKQINLVEGIVLENGYVIKSMRKNKSERIIQKAIAKQINSEISGGIWAIGYFPHDKPQYALAVAVENGISPQSVYSEIKERIILLNR